VVVVEDVSPAFGAAALITIGTQVDTLDDGPLEVPGDGGGRAEDRGARGGVPRGGAPDRPRRAPLWRRRVDDRLLRLQLPQLPAGVDLRGQRARLSHRARRRRGAGPLRPGRRELEGIGSVPMPTARIVEAVARTQPHGARRLA
jgi:hypothetical protein